MRQAGRGLGRSAARIAFPLSRVVPVQWMLNLIARRHDLKARQRAGVSSYKVSSET